MTSIFDSMILLILVVGGVPILPDDNTRYLKLTVAVKLSLGEEM